ncbi:hypothetical protein [Pseudomonas sp. TWP3-1]|uniref:hypothetical protein n=1 Tax=Pseudomonas sp. TWP3-1 TaxID=2804631 RepID=UPI003CEB47DC
MSRLFLIVLMAFQFGEWAHANGGPLPYKAWRLGFSAPNYMEVWIETADVIDIQGQVYRRAMSGVAAESGALA